MNNKLKKLVCGLTAIALLTGVLTACNGGKKDSDGKVSVSIGHWPNAEDEERLVTFEGYLEKMNEKYPDIEIIPDTYDYNLETFIVRAASNQLPTLYRTWYTEIQKVIDSGAAKDITDIMQERGFDKAMNPDILKLVSKDGRIYATPQDGYAQGLTINRKVFEEAGLVNEDGSVMIPGTYEELAEFAKTIKEKTGKAGFVMPSKGNIGGWHFMNIAWSFGADFVEKGDDGKYKAIFDTQECIDAFQYISDLKWKYNALQDNVLLSRGEIQKLVATDQAGMIIEAAPADDLKTWHDMDVTGLAFARMPEGPAGRYTQMGGNVRMVASNATDEQTDAVFKWIELTGEGPELDADAEASLEASLKDRKTVGHLVFDEVPFKMWVGEDRLQKENALRQKYMNMDKKYFADYMGFEDVIINPEPEACAQELYTIIDSCLQEILTNKDADIPALVKKANSDFQTNHLNKLD